MAHSDDFKLIREIVAAGGRKHTIGTLDRAKYQRLLELGWLKSFSPTPQRRVLLGHRTRRSSCLTRLKARVPERQIGFGELRLVTTGSDRRRNVADLKRLDELASIGRDFRDRADIVAERWRQAQSSPACRSRNPKSTPSAGTSRRTSARCDIWLPASEAAVMPPVEAPTAYSILRSC
jgi:hypothetical protein